VGKKKNKKKKNFCTPKKKKKPWALWIFKSKKIFFFFTGVFFGKMGPEKNRGVGARGGGTKAHLFFSGL